MQVVLPASPPAVLYIVGVSVFLSALASSAAGFPFVLITAMIFKLYVPGVDSLNLAFKQPSHDLCIICIKINFHFFFLSIVF